MRGQYAYYGISGNFRRSLVRRSGSGGDLAKWCRGGIAGSLAPLEPVHSLLKRHLAGSTDRPSYAFASKTLP